MATKFGMARSSAGCWTCRLRRKKCDEVRPACHGCRSLEIECVYGEEKPEWMDSDERRKTRADEVKAEIKRKAAWRRERRYLGSDENGNEDVEMVMSSDGECMTSVPKPTATPSSSTYELTPVSSSGASQAASTPATEAEAWKPWRASLNPPNVQNDQEMIMTMTYLDFIFPFLFPLYRPSIFTAGRGWLLVLLLKNKPLFHSALSMTSHFYPLLHDAHGGELLSKSSECHQHGWEQLQKQQAMSLRALQGEVRDVVAQGVEADLSRSARLVEAIVQVLCFDAVLAGIAAGPSAGDWTMHLGAATSLLEQMLEFGRRADPTAPAGPDTPSAGPWTRLLSHLGPGCGDVTRPSPNHPEQAALRFYASVLLHVDIVTSTGLDAPPRLTAHHPDLLAPSAAEGRPLPRGAAYPLLELQDVMGVETWCLCAIADIGALARWKKAQTAAGTLSLPELFRRAGALETELRSRLACQAARSTRTAAAVRAQQVPLSAAAAAAGAAATPNVFQWPALEAAPLDATAVTRPWAHAALAWLLAVANGWSARNLAIRTAVIDTAALMDGLPSPSCLRAMAWPLAVAGCLAMADMEEQFRAMVDAIARRREVFGSVSEAMAVVEAVWARRAEVEADEQAWDLARCFGLLGRTPFLM